MISNTTLQTNFGTLSQNTSTANLAFGAMLMNIEQRYLLQKYFSNEASFTITTIGSTTQAVTSAPIIGAVSATLAVSWAFPSCVTSVTFSDGEVRNVSFTNGSTAIAWQGALTGTQFTLTSTVAAAATTATLSTAWVASTGSYLIQFSDGEQKTVTLTSGSTSLSWSGGLSATVNAYFNTSVMTTSLSVGGVQSYRLPSDYSKLKTGTLTIGNLKWTPKEVLSRQEWDELNVFPYYADIPNNFFIYQNKFNLWPIPSTTGNIITFNYQRRIPDLSIADYTTPGTVSVTNGSNTVAGVATSFIATTNSVSESRWIQFAQPTGDNLWYQIASVDSTTGITLYSPYQGITVSGSSTYTIGQMPILLEDFQDMLLWKALSVYFTSIVDNPKKRAEYEDLYKNKLLLLEEYCGTKTVNVNLGRRQINRNPNLYWQA